MKYNLSKKDWIRIGQQAGWIKGAQGLFDDDLYDNTGRESEEYLYLRKIPFNLLRVDVKEEDKRYYNDKYTLTLKAGPYSYIGKCRATKDDVKCPQDSDYGCDCPDLDISIERAPDSKKGSTEFFEADTKAVEIVRDAMYSEMCSYLAHKHYGKET